ncbi:phosphatidylinositol mannoside acyltransferase [Modestobacter sp. Leaf380]|uniref:phosphatidylinositol mannoside acyltransferase n=1 Tax=Modestobacter sp. Leaf380 TaxID=1736356 RepID=UPI0006F3DE9D|nr:phosphatidylinositol mannoside acyltransferase [Modestobacter sp. Leaf380]KQS64922.1 lipid A biosynthesis lauroyl acyltransferase [Modestobacter sp. Leaf380]
MSRVDVARERLVDAGYAAGWGAVKALPEPVARAVFDRAGTWAAGRQGRGARQLRANLAVVTGLGGTELDTLTADGLRSYARYWMEAFRLPTLGVPRLLAGTTVVGTEHLEAARDAGRPVVLALPHSGNWDAAGVWFVDWLGGPFMTVAERLRPEQLYERFLAYRESLGFRVVPLTGGERPSSTLLKEWLGAGRSACLLVDRDLSASGIPVTFFDRPTTMPGGPALLAAQTAAALLPAVSHFDGTGWRHTVHPEVDVHGPGRLRDRVHAGMQGVADAFAVSIAERPVDWHQLGRIWADVRPEPAR